MKNNRKQPEIIVFAGPNGSGKSTITLLTKVIKPYINADEIQACSYVDNLSAAKKAEELREKCVREGISFTFETVLSTERNLKLLEKAKKKGFFIRCYYVLTVDPEINVFRVKTRTKCGGHSVPATKIRQRYERGLKLIPRLLETCDICHVYDNSEQPSRIFKKRKEQILAWETSLWTRQQIAYLIFEGKRRNDI